MNYLGKNINTLRKSFGFSNQELAEKIGTSKSSISRFENTGHVPAYEIKKLAVLFCVSEERLLDTEISLEEALDIALSIAPKRATRANLNDEDTPYYSAEGRAPKPTHDMGLAMYVGKVIDGILTKHHTPRARYAEQSLNRDPRTLQRIIKGDIMADFATILQVVMDHGESLELFRTGPLPKGHLLSQIKDKELIIATQQALIEALRHER